MNFKEMSEEIKRLNLELCNIVKQRFSIYMEILYTGKGYTFCDVVYGTENIKVVAFTYEKNDAEREYFYLPINWMDLDEPAFREILMEMKKENDDFRAKMNTKNKKKARIEALKKELEKLENES